MGAWGAGNLENDDALDWLGDLADHTRPKLLKRVDPMAPVSTLIEKIESIISAGEYLEAHDACCCLAAGEAVCTVGGRPAEHSTESLDTWAGRTRAAAEVPGLAARIAECTAFVRDSDDRSELRQLWDEAGSLGEWNSHVDDLIDRLRVVAASS